MSHTAGPHRSGGAQPSGGPHRPHARGATANRTARTGLRRHLRRAVGAEHNPLSRSYDRIRSAAVLICVLLLAGVAAAACAVALAVLHGALVSVAQQEVHRHQIAAVTTGAALAGAVSEAPATWTYPAGSRHAAWISVPDGTKAGATVATWVDDTGASTAPPRSTTDAYASSVLSGVATLFGGALLILGASAGGKALVDRRAATAWDAEWSRVEPGWSGRSRPRGAL